MYLKKIYIGGCNMKKYTIDISLIEDEFIEKMEQTKKNDCLIQK